MAMFALAILLCLPLFAAATQAQQVTLKMDLVYIIHDEAQCDTHENHRWRDFHVKTMGNRTSEVFKIHNDHVRVAIVANAQQLPHDRYDWATIKTMTGDSSQWKTELGQLEIYNQLFCPGRRRGMNLHRALELADEQLASSGDRVKVVFIASMPWPESNKNSETAGQEGRFARALDKAKEMHKKGIEILIMFRYAFGHTPGSRLTEHSQPGIGPQYADAQAFVTANEVSVKYVSREDHLFDQNTTTKDSGIVEWIKKTVGERECVYEFKCFFYMSQEKCHERGYTPRVPTNIGDCYAQFGISDQIPGRQASDCAKADCEKVCDDLWPWNVAREKLPTCERQCGVTDVQRSTDSPQYPQLEHCPYQFACPPCTSKPPERTNPPNEMPTYRVPPATDPPYEDSSGRSRYAVGGKLELAIMVGVSAIASMVRVHG